jgi:hypothetical protein
MMIEVPGTIDQKLVKLPEDILIDIVDLRIACRGFAQLTSFETPILYCSRRKLAGIEVFARH